MKLNFRNVEGGGSLSHGVTPLLIPSSTGNLHPNQDSSPGQSTIYLAPSQPPPNSHQPSQGPVFSDSRRCRVSWGQGFFYILGILVILTLPFALPVAVSHAVRIVDWPATTPGFPRMFPTNPQTLHGNNGRNISTQSLMEVQKGIPAPVSVPVSAAEASIASLQIPKTKSFGSSAAQTVPGAFRTLPASELQNNLNPTMVASLPVQSATSGASARSAIPAAPIVEHQGENHVPPNPDGAIEHTQYKAENKLGQASGAAATEALPQVFMARNDNRADRSLTQDSRSGAVELDAPSKPVSKDNQVDAYAVVPANPLAEMDNTMEKRFSHVTSGAAMPIEHVKPPIAPADHRMENHFYQAATGATMPIEQGKSTMVHGGHQVEKPLEHAASAAAILPVEQANSPAVSIARNVEKPVENVDAGALLSNEHAKPSTASAVHPVETLLEHTGPGAPVSVGQGRAPQTTVHDHAENALDHVASGATMSREQARRSVDSHSERLLEQGANGVAESLVPEKTGFSRGAQEAGKGLGQALEGASGQIGYSHAGEREKLANEGIGQTRSLQNVEGQGDVSTGLKNTKMEGVEGGRRLEAVVDEWNKYAVVRYGNLYLSETFESRLNEQVGWKIYEKHPELFGNVQRECGGKPDISFSFRASPRIHAVLEIVMQCGENASSCTISPEVEDLRRLHVNVGSGNGEHFLRADANQDSEGVSWGPLMGPLKVRLTENSMIVLKKTCTDQAATVARVLSVGQIKGILREIEEAKGVGKGEGTGTESGLFDVFKYDAHPYHHINGLREVGGK